MNPTSVVCSWCGMASVGVAWSQWALALPLWVCSTEEVARLCDSFLVGYGLSPPFLYQQEYILSQLTESLAQCFPCLVSADQML